MLDFRGFLIVAVLFGGVVIASVSSLLRGTVNHGDPAYEFKNEGPKITSGNRRDMQVPDWVRRRRPDMREPTYSTQKEVGTQQANPFMK